ncbi:uncharacterized protein LOC113864476 [Abrus precatorius]|uniref:Uncharacterized protein LOC113864476 n=1 Tax=Abrus precatorius TaxID=3816 RepID=A0A8B8LCF8_ABRPR|nr:uncharacterized protein LOC113864476 [Abrus precatorius]
MATQTIVETAQKIVTPETLRYAANQSQRCLVVPVRLRRAIKKYLREQEEPYMRRKVLRLSQSFNQIKDVNLQLATSTAEKIVEDPLKSFEQSKRWKIKSAYGDIGLTYTDAETIAYVASRMPAVYSACYRVLKEVRRRLPGFSPSKVLDFGAGTGSAFWALQEVWPKSLEKINLIEPSQSMQRAGRSLIQGLKNLPLIHSYDSIQALSKSISKSDRGHDLVIASYVLGEIPSLKDRITIVRQLWDLTQDVLVLVEPGTPHGSNIITQMRSHILWMEERKHRKSSHKNKEVCKDLITQNACAFVVAPCPHDGTCPLVKSGKYCHFVQRLERTSSQRAYKRSKGEPLRGFEDEKFSYVVFRRGQRPREPWPLDGLKFDTLKEQHAKRNPEDLEIDYEDWLKLQQADDTPHEVADAVTYDSDDLETGDGPREAVNAVTYDSDVVETDAANDNEEDKDAEEERASADLGGGWGRIVFMPVRRGRQVTMNVCRSTKRDASEGSYDRIVVTHSKNPTLHRQAKRSIWAKDTDIIVATTPKSGTTWLKALTFSIVNRQCFSIENHPLLTSNPHELVPYFEHDIYANNHDQIPHLPNMIEPRLFGTHIPFHALTKSSKESNCKIIYICRNLFDTFVSTWIFNNKVKQESLPDLTLEEAFESYCKGITNYGPWWNHMLGYWKESIVRPNKVLFLKYEDLKEDVSFQVRKIAEFLGCPFTQEEESSGMIENIIKLCNFEKMKDLEVNKFGRTFSRVDNKNFFRKAEIGDWKNYLSPSMVEKLSKIIDEKFSGSGLSFKVHS